MQGTVKDASGAVVPNATIIVTNTETGVVSNATTNGSGQYRVNSLAPGRYIVHVTASGFQGKDTTANITTGQDAGIDVVLGIESNQQSVDVSADAEGLNPEETRIQATLDTQQVRDLPLQGRGTLNLVNTAPGVSGYSEGLNNFAVSRRLAATRTATTMVATYMCWTAFRSPPTSRPVRPTSPNSDSVQEVVLEVNNFRIDFAGG